MENAFLIIGLGNPGSQYTKTRHNVGFLAIDNLKQSLNISGDFKEETKFASEILVGEFQDKKVILAKPLTFMNNSGSAVQKLMSYYKIEPENMIIIFDDLDVEIGKFKIQTDKAPRKHNGYNSIIGTMGDRNFYRVRIGIENRGDLRPVIGGKDYVLMPFNTNERILLENSVLPEISQAVQTIINN